MPTVINGGNRREFPWHCLHLFVPAKTSPVDGLGENKPHPGQTACRIDGIHIWNTKVCDTTATTESMVKEEPIRRDPWKWSEQGHGTVKDPTKRGGPCTSVIAATANQERCTTATIVQEIRRDLNVIALRYAKLPHPIVVPPTVGRILCATGEVVSPEVDNRVEVVYETLTG